MSKFYLAIDYGGYEGWLLEEFDSIEAILIEVIERMIISPTKGLKILRPGIDWKILKELF